MGYAESTVKASTNYTKDFFQWLEDIGINNLSQINYQVIKNYHNHLQNRKNKRAQGALSDNYIISNINALKRLSKYLQESGKANLEIGLRLKAPTTNSISVLTKEEVKSMYRACGNDTLGIRDRAILSIYYGCGLRRSEGQALDLKDIFLKEKRVFVRKGKNHKERYVPITEAIKDDLENYIFPSKSDFDSVSVGSIINASWTINGK